MGITPSQEQVTAQLRIIIPALGTIVTAFGISQTQSNLYTQMILDSVGPISYLICGIWSLIANTRQSIIAKAAKPADANTPAPLIVLPPQEAHIADALPANVTSSAVAVAKVLIIALALASLVAAGSAQAQAKLKSPQQIGEDIKNAIDKTNSGVKAAITGTPDKTAALPCMDLSVLTKLNPFNLVPTIKGCEQDGIKQLISDATRALASAEAYVGPNGGAQGDGDGIACHKPALALWQVALNIPAVPEVPAVLNADGSIKTPAIPGTPEIVAGPILIAQKFGEFVKSGGITSCTTWINNQINAVAAAGVGGIATVTAGAALIPK